MTTSADDLRARVRQLNFPSDDGSGGGGGGGAAGQGLHLGGGGPAGFNPSPNSSLSGRGPRPRPSLGLAGVGNSFAMGSPTARRPTPDSLNLGVSSPFLFFFFKLPLTGSAAARSAKLHWDVRPAAAEPGPVREADGRDHEAERHAHHRRQEVCHAH